MTHNHGRIIPVLLSGGTGTRLWPLSRETYPKQLLSLLGEKTLLQQTALRVSDPAIFGNVMVVANAEHRFAIAEQLRAVGVVDPTMILEPFGRNTAPAIATAALVASEKDPDAIILAMPVDHWVKNADKPGTTTFEWHPLIVTDELAIIEATTNYPKKTFSNLWVLRLDNSGQARQFTEWWMKHKD